MGQWRRGTGGTLRNTDLMWAELAGIAAGPAAYIRGRSANRLMSERNI